MNFSDTILLTGAGFTANFGGFLAREVWSKIFNNPKLNDAGNLKLELRKNFDSRSPARPAGSTVPNIEEHTNYFSSVTQRLRLHYHLTSTLQIPMVLENYEVIN